MIPALEYIRCISSFEALTKFGSADLLDFYGKSAPTPPNSAADTATDISRSWWSSCRTYLSIGSSRCSHVDWAGHDGMRAV